MREAIEEEVQAMLELGVIEPSQSEWRSPVVLVPKPDGSWQFCIDFWRVNAISKFDAYPMPRIDELLDWLGEACYITTLDLTKGYWQIPLDPRSKEKTAFATPSGLYHFTQMPFSLHGALATFQHLMDRVLQPHTKYAAAYLDDVVIYGNNWEEHLNQVVAVLRDLRAAGLMANPKKNAESGGRKPLTWGTPGTGPPPHREGPSTPEMSGADHEEASTSIFGLSWLLLVVCTPLRKHYGPANRALDQGQSPPGALVQQVRDGLSNDQRMAVQRSNTLQP
ncbi:unnamed protein product [Lepidochelys kempii]